MPMTTLPLNEMLLRLSLAFIAGLVMGFERERHGRAAGLRTTMLACVASCLAMILSHHFAVEYASADQSTWRPDPGRLAAGILTGIGFLGAGTIVRQDGSVRGVTTAAALWYATILGLIFGSGQHALGLAGWVIALFALYLLPRLEEHIERTQHAVVSVTMQLEGEAEGKLRQIIEEQGAEIESMLLDIDVLAKEQSIRYDIKFKKSGLSEVPQAVVRDLSESAGVLRVGWK